MSAPTYVTYFTLLSLIGIIAAALAGLRVAVGRADWEQSQRAATLRTATVLLLLWFAAAVALSYAGAFRGTPGRQPTIASPAAAGAMHFAPASQTCSRQVPMARHTLAWSIG